jgi:hypothetical protein
MIHRNREEEDEDAGAKVLQKEKRLLTKTSRQERGQ